MVGRLDDVVPLEPNPELTLIDHNTEETLPLVLATGCWAGPWPIASTAPACSIRVHEGD